MHAKDPWSLALENNLPGTWAGVTIDGLRVTRESQGDALTGLPELITKIEVDPQLMIQGGTTVIKVFAPPGLTMRGSLAERNLNFFPQNYGYVALQGIHALTPPGLYPLTLEGELPNDNSFTFSQNVLVQDAKFPYDPAWKWILQQWIRQSQNPKGNCGNRWV